MKKIPKTTIIFGVLIFVLSGFVGWQFFRIKNLESQFAQQIVQQETRIAKLNKSLSDYSSTASSVEGRLNTLWKIWDAFHANYNADNEIYKLQEEVTYIENKLGISSYAFLQWYQKALKQQEYEKNKNKSFGELVPPPITVWGTDTGY